MEMEEIYQPETVLETERLILRPLQYDDEDAIFKYINNDREVLKYYLAPYHEKPNYEYLAATIDFCKKTQRYCWAMVLKETGEVIGMMNQCNSLNIFFQSVEIGYAIGRPYWNRGLTTEALVKVMDFLFDRGVHKVYCGCISENTASRKVMLKAGMQFEAMKVDELYYHDRFWNEELYYCLNPKTDF